MSYYDKPLKFKFVSFNYYEELKMRKLLSVSRNKGYFVLIDSLEGIVEKTGC
jgi:hypothetical protein